PFLDDPDPAVRRAAVGAVTHLLLAPELAARRPEVADRLLRSAAQPPPVDRAGVALAVGRWGLAPHALRTDPHPGVRASAAIAPAFDGDPAALAEIRRGLRDPRAADAWFGENPPQLDGRVSFTSVEALLRRTASFDEVVDEALAIARMTNAYTVDRDWGPLLVRAFPGRFTPGRRLTDAQRRFLAAIADNEACWGRVA